MGAGGRQTCGSPKPGSVCLSGGEPPPVPSSGDLRSRAHCSSIPADTSEFQGKRADYSLGWGLSQAEGASWLAKHSRAHRAPSSSFAQQTALLLKVGVGCVKLPVRSCPGPAPGAAALVLCVRAGVEEGPPGCIHVSQGSCLSARREAQQSPPHPFGQALTEILQRPERARGMPCEVLLHPW